MENVGIAQTRLSEATKKRLKAGRMLLAGKGCAEVALAVGVIAVLLETFSDIQLHRFRRQNTDREAFLQSGLWAYSRHPNYCGEAMYWWSTALFALSVRLSPLMVLGAVGVSCMILFASIPMAEKRALAKRPRFADYQRRVSRLIPWFPRRA